MARPDAGALGATFKSGRIVQTMCLLAIIGLASNFVSQIVSSNQTPPEELVGTLSIVGSIDISVCVS